MAVVQPLVRKGGRNRRMDKADALPGTLAARQRQTLTGTGGQKQFTVQGGYSLLGGTALLDVYINGVYITEYTATDGSTFTLTDGLDSVSDEVVVTALTLNALAASSGSTTDPNYAKVAVLSHFDAVPFVDQKAHTISTTGTVTLSSAPKFGAGAANFTATGAVDIAASADLNIGTGDFTLEFWVKTSTSSAPGLQVIVSSPSSWSKDTLLRIWQNDSGSQFGVVDAIQLSKPDGNGYLVDTKTIVTDGKWHHIAFARQSGTLRAFFDGALNDTVTGNTTNFSSPSTDGIRIGSNNGSRFYKGEMDDFRITIGVARYTAAFTPPTAAFPDQ